MRPSDTAQGPAPPDRVQGRQDRPLVGRPQERVRVRPRVQLQRPPEPRLVLRAERPEERHRSYQPPGVVRVRRVEISPYDLTRGRITFRIRN